MNFNEKLECIFINTQNCPHCKKKIYRQNDLCKQCRRCYAYGSYKFYISLYSRTLDMYINEIDSIVTLSEYSLSLDDSYRSTIFVENPSDLLIVTDPFIKIEKLKTYLLFQ